MDNREIRTITDAIKKTKDYLGETDESQTNAEEVFKELKDSKPPIETLPYMTEAEVKKVDVDKYKDYNEDNVSRMFGLDASRTQVHTMGSKSKVCISNCRVGVKRIGDTEEAYDFENKSVISMVIYTKKDIDTEKLREIEEENSDQDTQLLIRDSGEIESREDQYLKRTSLLLAEGTALKNVITTVKDKIKGPEKGLILLDGPLYPLAILRNQIFDSDKYQDDESWNGLLKEITSNYKESISISIKETIPIIGFVKNIDTRTLVNTIDEIDEESKIVWPSDEAFLSDLLYTRDSTEITYTNWFEEIDADQIEKAPKALFKNDMEFDEENYNKRYFYVRLPKKGSIIRVETTRAIAKSKLARKMIQKRALAEISKSKDVPNPIVEADEQARIEKSQQEKIREVLLGTTSNYNEERRLN